MALTLIYVWIIFKSYTDFYSQCCMYGRAYMYKFQIDFAVYTLKIFNRGELQYFIILMGGQSLNKI